MEKYAKLPMFTPLRGRTAYTDVSPDDALRYFGDYLVTVFETDVLDVLRFTRTDITDRDFIAVMPQKRSGRVYLIVSLKGDMEVMIGTGDKTKVREGVVVALANPYASQTGVRIKVKDCLGKANVHVFEACI